jgi:hypothetical protein
MNDIPDVDIEVRNRDQVVELFEHAVPASQVAKDALVRHISGVYFQDIPRHPISRIAVFDAKDAEEIGYYKVDFLSAPTPYDGIENMDALRALMAAPVDWSWFRRIDFVQDLFHLRGIVMQGLSMAEVVAHYAPASIIDLACMVAIKMPAKKYLIGETWETVREHIWVKEAKSKGQQFKKSHSVCYSMVVAMDAKRKAMQFFGDHEC